MAGGLASRMGECKVLLPIAGKTALEQAVSRMRLAGVTEIIVVTGMYEEAVRAEALRLGCQPTHNPLFRSGMFSSVRSGALALPSSVRSFFFLPGDIPLVKPFTYRALMESSSEDARFAAYPTFKGESCHPPLIGSGLIEEILAYDGEGGLRGLLERVPHRCITVPTADRGATLDMDTPEDYRRLLAYGENEFFPDEEECEELLALAGTPAEVVAHSRFVAGLASLLAETAAPFCQGINRRLVLAASYLHDLAKGQPNHAEKSAGWLSERGYERTAEIILCHMEIPQQAGPESRILYLADKRVSGTELVTIAEKRAAAVKRFQGDALALQGAMARLKRAEEIELWFEKITGMSVNSVFSSV